MYWTLLVCLTMYNVYISYKIVKLSQVNIDTHVNGEICAQLGWGGVGYGGVE